MQADLSSRSRFVFAAVGLWVVVAAAAALLLPAPQAPTGVRASFVLGPVIVFAIALWTMPSVARVANAIDPRRLVAAHIIRFVVGVAFLLLARAGQLPWEFALHAGIGDMLAGAGALGLVIGWKSVVAGRGRLVLLLWNVFGAIDFLNVQRVVRSLEGREHELIAMNHLPLSLIPYLAVPALFATHVLMLTKLLRDRRQLGFAAGLSALLLIGCSDAGSEVRVRAANLSVELTSAVVCVDGESVATVPYGSMTRYWNVASSGELRSDVYAAGASCDDDSPLATGSFSTSATAAFTLVVFGDPNDSTHPLQIALLLDESGAPAATAAKVRNFHTDTEAPSIDVGFPLPSGQRALLFGDVAYGRTARASGIGTLSARGYVDGVPAPFRAPRLFVWPSGENTPLGFFEGSIVPFAGGRVYSVFPAGRVRSGTPEAIICEETADPATEEAPWSDCRAFPATRAE